MPADCYCRRQEMICKLLWYLQRQYVSWSHSRKQQRRHFIAGLRKCLLSKWRGTLSSLMSAHKWRETVLLLSSLCSCSPNYDLQSACLLKHSSLSTSTSNMKSWCQISWWLSNYCYNINSVARVCFLFLLSTLMSPALTRHQHDAIDCKKFARLILRVISKGLMIETPASYSFYSVHLSLVNQFDTKVSWFLPYQRGLTIPLETELFKCM